MIRKLLKKLFGAKEPAAGAAKPAAKSAAKPVAEHGKKHQGHGPEHREPARRGSQVKGRFVAHRPCHQRAGRQAAHPGRQSRPGPRVPMGVERRRV
ncbi:MAG TPA: hypothetical protein VI078_16960, partial [bacterium]